MEKVHNYQSLFVGQNFKVPTINNRYETYINFDNAATTPALKRVMDKMHHSLFPIDYLMLNPIMIVNILIL